MPIKDLSQHAFRAPFPWLPGFGRVGNQSPPPPSLKGDYLGSEAYRGAGLETKPCICITTANSGAAEVQVQIMCPSNLGNSEIVRAFRPVPILSLDPDMTFQVNFAGPNRKEQKISLS